MAWKIDTSDAHFIRVTCQGVIRDEDVVAQVLEGIDIIVRRKMSQALIDYSGAVITMSITNIYHLPDLFVDHGMPVGIQIAMVLPIDAQSILKSNFFDDVANNRGYRVKLFNSTDEALAWLRTEA